MEYLILLVLTLLVMSVFFYFIFRRDIIAPPVVMSAMFTISAIVALLNASEWRIDFSFAAFMIISSGIIVFAIPMMLLQRPDSAQAVTSPNRLIDISWTKMMFAILSSALMVFLYRREIYQMADRAGYAGTSVQWFIRNATSYEGELSINTAVRILIRWVDAVAYIGGYTFISNRLIYGHKRGKDWFLLLPICLFAYKTFLVGGRQDILKLVIAMVVQMYIIHKRKVGWHKVISSKYIKIGFWGIILGIPAFYYSLALTGRTTTRTLGQSISTYLGGSIQHFNQYLSAPPLKGDIFGHETFVPILNSLGNAGFISYHNTVHLEFRPLSITIGNVYTFFRRPLQDFGLVGMYLFVMMVSLFFAYFYYFRIKNSKTSFKNDVYTIIYSYIFYWIFLSSIEQYAISTLSLFTLINIIFFYLAAVFFWKIRFRRGKLYFLNLDAPNGQTDECEKLQQKT